MSDKLVTKFREITHSSTHLFIHSFCPTIWTKKQELGQSLKEHLSVCIRLNLHSVASCLDDETSLSSCQTRSRLEKVRGV